MMEEEGGGGHENSERWLVSYADFITLLFALFVLMYAVSNADRASRARVFMSVESAVGARPERGGLRPDMVDSGHGKLNEIEPLTLVREQVDRDLDSHPNSGITTKMDSRGLVISLSAAKFFASGAADINPEQLPALKAVIDRIAPLPNPLEIDGFTDSVPIQSGGTFRDNWELSAARAATVLRYALSVSAIDPSRMTLAGYGPYRPIASDTSEDGRALNRRVEIVVKKLEDSM